MKIYLAQNVWQYMGKETIAAFKTELEAWRFLAKQVPDNERQHFVEPMELHDE